MSILPNLKLKALVSFPSTVYGGTGIEVNKTNGNFTVGLDYSEFTFQGTLPTGGNVLVWVPVTNVYTLVPPSATGGISDAPSDSLTYGRRNGVWVDAWASPALTGNPTAPTPTAGDNDTSIATTAFVSTAIAALPAGTPPPSPAFATPLAEGTGAVGVSLKYAREDHVHPAGAAGSGDVTGPASAVADRIAVFNGTTGKIIKDGGKTVAELAPLASPTFTGDPKAPTPTAGDNDTSIATTAFVTTSVAAGADQTFTASSPFTNYNHAYESGENTPTQTRAANRIWRSEMVGNHAGSAHFLFGMEARPIGSLGNGNWNGDFALGISSLKHNWQSQALAQSGEVGGIWIGARNGGPSAENSDCSALMCDVTTTGDSGYAVGIEGITVRLDATPAPTQQISYSVGVIDGKTAMGTGSHGMAVNALLGTAQYGFLAAGTTGSGTISYPFAYVTTGGGLIWYVDTNGAMTSNGGYTSYGDISVNKASPSVTANAIGGGMPSLYFKITNAVVSSIYDNGGGIVVASNAAQTQGMYITHGVSSWTALSDARLPEKVGAKHLTMLDRIDKIQVYENTYDGRLTLFVITQEFVGCLPHLVKVGTDDAKHIPTGLDDPDAWGVSYDRAGVAALQLGKEIYADMTRQILELTQRVTALEAALVPPAPPTP